MKTYIINPYYDSCMARRTAATGLSIALSSRKPPLAALGLSFQILHFKCRVLKPGVITKKVSGAFGLHRGKSMHCDSFAPSLVEFLNDDDKTRKHSRRRSLLPHAGIQVAPSGPQVALNGKHFPLLSVCVLCVLWCSPVPAISSTLPLHRRSPTYTK